MFLQKTFDQTAFLECLSISGVLAVQHVITIIIKREIFEIEIQEVSVMRMPLTFHVRSMICEIHVDTLAQRLSVLF